MLVPKSRSGTLEPHGDCNRGGQYPYFEQWIISTHIHLLILNEIGCFIWLQPCFIYIRTNEATRQTKMSGQEQLKVALCGKNSSGMTSAKVRVYGYTSANSPFFKEAKALKASANGCLLILNAAVSR